MALTKLQALKGSLEFQLENDILYEKVLLDHGLTGSDSYTGSSKDQEDIDLCKADIYLELAAGPDMKDGNSQVTWSEKKLLGARRALYRKWGLNPPEAVNRPADIDGEQDW